MNALLVPVIVYVHSDIIFWIRDILEKVFYNIFIFFKIQNVHFKNATKMFSSCQNGLKYCACNSHKGKYNILMLSPMLNLNASENMLSEFNFTQATVH